jgi:hypothetical protein
VQRPRERERVRQAQHPQRHVSIVLIRHKVLRAVARRRLGQGAQPQGVGPRRQRQAVAEQQARQHRRPQRGRGRQALAQLCQQGRDAAPLARARRRLKLEFIVCGRLGRRLHRHAAGVEERGGRQVQQRGLLLG